MGCASYLTHSAFTQVSAVICDDVFYLEYGFSTSGGERPVVNASRCTYTYVFAMRGSWGMSDQCSSSLVIFGSCRIVCSVNGSSRTVVAGSATVRD